LKYNVLIRNEIIFVFVIQS